MLSIFSVVYIQYLLIFKKCIFYYIFIYYFSDNMINNKYNAYFIIFYPMLVNDSIVLLSAIISKTLEN